MDGLLEALETGGVPCVWKGSCTSDMYANPLRRQVDADEGVQGAGAAAAVAVAVDAAAKVWEEDGDSFVLHFYDLAAMKPHTMFHFVKGGEGGGGGGGGEEGLASV